MFYKDKTGGARFKIEEGVNETIIGPSVKVEGDFASEGNVLVQGMVNGSLKTKGNLRVEKGAKIKASIEASNALVHGEIKGNVTVQNNLEIGETAIVEGDIATKIISIAPGAAISGHCLVTAIERQARSQGAEPATIQKPAIERERA